MREIKFRAWDKKTKAMYHVDKLHLPVDSFSRGRAIAELVFLDNHPTYNHYVRTPSEHILMQYTGLKDKNGVEIYEGDIVKCKLSSTQRYKGIIQFDNGHFFIQAFWYSFKPIGRWDLEERKLCGESNTKLSIDCEMEVIGNVQENPELLEKRK